MVRFNAHCQCHAGTNACMYTRNVNWRSRYREMQQHAHLAIGQVERMMESQQFSGDEA